MGLRDVLATIRGVLRSDPEVRRNRATGTHCFYCAVEFSGDGDLARTVDHRVPRGAGGTDGLANMVFACRGCNQRKRDLPEETFVASGWLARRKQAVSSGEVHDRPPPDGRPPRPRRRIRSAGERSHRPDR
jgi:5-methylcytosine-specific restriction endonuclease McrA